MRETAGLPQFIEREEERRVLEKDSYVDDILTSHDDLEMLDTIMSGVEEILSAGGFSLKPWVRSGQVYATRLRKYVERHSRLQIEHWIHLVDSRTVLGAIQRESYGYQSFFANRISEIQKAGSPTEWWWIPGECNVADIITRGAAPEELSEDSPWQKGPGFLEKPFEEWPVKSAAEVAADARETLEELYGYLSKVDKVKLEEEAASHGTEWSWKFHPADSPHRNGAAEAAVKVVKRALRAIDKKGPFTLVELQTLLYLAANLANERPIEARIQAQEDDVIEYLSPNSLLLGRTGPKGDSGGFKWDYPFQRFQAVQGAVSEFWRRWSQLAGPNLFTRPKWHTRERNVAVGDLVWLADQNALRCQYRLGRVVQVVADSAGVVRDVRVRTVPACPASPGGAKTREKKGSGKLPGVVLHRDVRRIVVVLPIEEQGTFVASLDNFDYEDAGYQTADLVKVDILLNGKPVEELTVIVHKDKAYSSGKAMCERLKDSIPRQLFEIAVQAAIGSKVIARETIKAYRKNVLAKCYGGDVTRKMKLLKKQAEGKKKMRRVGNVEIPKDTFINVLKRKEK
ncbi:hypothetical protein AAFF_G00276100 [Aldrovandia affinis]|uniref:Uncharacterized protein n=1 Tax=Aldrovandia affinis TaxID=143900 RepID=A0AAD7W1E6_9TELE|nr:hypothetical protein AAFF_G00276100 [Aldrovandia affinis]